MSFTTKVHITFVKKIMEDGNMCAKCADVSARLEKDGLLEKINYIAIADSKDKDSEGMLLAQKYKVERAPFFIVEDEDGHIETFDVYFKFKRFIEKYFRSMSAIAEVA